MPMARCIQAVGAFLAPGCAIVLLSRAVFAAPSDAPASKLRDDAIDNDYLATSYASAEAKLKSALMLCKGPADCSPAIRARLRCDLGVVELMLKRVEDGRAQFAAALKEDPTLTLDADLSTPDLEREFAAVKAGAASAAGSGSAGAPPVARVPTSEDPTDCPPSFPGCSAGAKGAACGSSEECAAGETCSDGACVESREPVEHAAYKRNWLSVAFEENALLLPSAANACAGGTGYTCFNGGSYYSATPLAGADDQVSGGIALATSRILVGYDRAIGENFTAGVRLGYAFGGGPQRPTASSFLPIHVEVRGTYWFGDNPLARSGVRFFVLAAGGMAQIDASVPVTVYASSQAYTSQEAQSYQAWKKTGLGFGAIGAGAKLAITPSTGVALEAKVIEMFPTTATGFGGQVAFVEGF
jgi:hypothetical protein